MDGKNILSNCYFMFLIESAHGKGAPLLGWEIANTNE